MVNTHAWSKRHLIDALLIAIIVGAILAIALRIFYEYRPAVAEDDRDYTRVPEELQGTWCRDADESKCINFADIIELWPEATIDFADPGNGSPTDVFVCLESLCTVPTSFSFEYYPVGVVWNCKEKAESYGLSSCNPDYSEMHDVSRVRLRKPIDNFKPQHNPEYYDNEPLYLNPSAFGLFGDLSVLYD